MNAILIYAQQLILEVAAHCRFYKYGEIILNIGGKALSLCTRFGNRDYVEGFGLIATTIKNC